MRYSSTWTKYKTIEKITDLLNSYGISSEKQDKEIIKHRKFLWDNRNELDEIEINENCGPPECACLTKWDRQTKRSQKLEGPWRGTFNLPKFTFLKIKSEEHISKTKQMIYLFSLVPGSFQTNTRV